MKNNILILFLLWATSIFSMEIEDDYNQKFSSHFRKNYTIQITSLLDAQEWNKLARLIFELKEEMTHTASLKIDHISGLFIQLVEDYEIYEETEERISNLAANFKEDPEDVYELYKFSCRVIDAHNKKEEFTLSQEYYDNFINRDVLERLIKVYHYPLLKILDTTKIIDKEVIKKGIKSHYITIYEIFHGNVKIICANSPLIRDWLREKISFYITKNGPQNFAAAKVLINSFKELSNAPTEDIKVLSESLHQVEQTYDLYLKIIS